MFKKILIANRGEIACRVAATARRLGIRSVAVYSDADADAKHVHACDEAVRIGPASPNESYLRGERIIDAAKATGAEAIHPGYGFLSENAAFAEACAAAGLVFIGPPPAAIRAMGLKAEAKQLMQHAGVPLVPGYHGADQDPALLAAEAARIGYPVLIKASAGGGGKGMRIVASADAFATALASCQREAMSSFGNDAVLIERYVTRPRHIEIQLFADGHGDCVYLFERDCSVQRRHQKVLEEAPAPGISAERRREMGEAAVAAARAVGYVGAGTVEFIAEPVDAAAGDDARDGADACGGADARDGADARGGVDARGGADARDVPDVGDVADAADRGDGDSGAAVGADRPAGDLRFYFMEMNTRLQVEHPVTEAITGLDLVEWQLRVAAGEPLPLRQHELSIAGHAIEARLCAENPDAGFLPATGPLDVYRLPPAAVEFERGAVRVDGGVREGDRVTPHYDPMIAKLIVWGRDRDEALARLDAALAATHIVGVQSNVAFLRRVVASPSFANADLDTALIEREHARLFEQRGLALEVAAAGVVADALAAEHDLEDADPWSRRDGWRLHGSALRRFNIDVGDGHHVFTLERARNGAQALVHGAERRAFAATPHGAGVHDVTLGERRLTLAVYATVQKVSVFGTDGSAVVERIDEIADAGHDLVEAGRLTAPMPGKVIAFLAEPGQKVAAGQALAVMEAMKMEHTINAPRDGTVAELLYATGDQVDEGSELLRLVAES